MKSNKIKAILFCTTIFLTTVLSMQDSAILPISNALYEAYPNSTLAVNFAVSGPSILMLFSSLLVPYLYKFMSKKLTLLATCVVFLVTCIFASFTMNLPLLVTYRTIGGICCGIQQVVAVDSLSGYFADEKTRATVVGLYNAAQAAVGAVLGVAAGILAVGGWERVYNVFWVNIPITLLVLFFVPNQENAAGQQEDGKDTAKKGQKVSMGSKFWVSALNFTVFCVIYAPLYFMAAVYIGANGLGNEAYAGAATSLGTVGSMAASILFGLVYRKLEIKTGIISYVMMAAGLFLAFFIANSSFFLAISVLGGAAYGLLLSYQYANISAILPPAAVTRAISYVTALNALGIFLTTYITTALMGIFGGIMPVVLLFGAVAVVCMVIEIVNTKNM